METSWAIRLNRKDAGSLSPLRLVPNLEVAITEEDVWLRGPHGDDKLERSLCALPAQERFERVGHNLLRPLRKRVPCRTLPDLPWLPLQAWSQVLLPSAALSGIRPPAIPVRLERFGNEQDPELLLTALEEFQQFTARAPQLRLKSLRFAASADRLVLIHGTPLPPLPGQRFVLHGRLAVSAGFGWFPAVDVEVLLHSFAASPDTIILWNQDGSLSRFQSEQFMPVSRSSVLATQLALDEPK